MNSMNECVTDRRVDAADPESRLLATDSCNSLSHSVRPAALNRVSRQRHLKFKSLLVVLMFLALSELQGFRESERRL